MKQVIIKISPDAKKVEVEAAGFVGAECQTATAGIENKLFGGNVERDLKEEYYQTDTVKVEEYETN